MPTEKKHIFAYLVGIGDYPNADHRLKGPKEDLKLIEEILDVIELRKKAKVTRQILKDKSATRNKVINGFSIFNQAKAEDICLFYFSGHGSRIPGAMFSDSQNGKIESIVCYDSRNENGLDLADKELAYLLKKEVPMNCQLVVVMDCCHAGQNSRGKYVQEKNVLDSEITREISTFEGWEEYSPSIASGNPMFSVYSMPHIHMAACAPHQKAKEIEIDGKAVGAFTFSLHEALMKGNQSFVYSQLVAQARLRCNQFVSNQTPQLETINLDPIKKEQLFLNGTWSQGQSPYFLFLDDDEGWKLNAGQINLVDSTDEVLLKNPPQVLRIGEVGMTDAQVLGVNQLDPTKVYPCLIKRKFSTSIKLFCKPTISKKLKTAISKSSGEYWVVVKKESLATHFLELEKDQIVCLTKTTGQISWKITLHKKNQVMANTISNRLEQLGRFHHVLSLTNPHSFIDLNEVEIQIQVQDRNGNGQLLEPQKHSIHDLISASQVVVNEQFLSPEISLDISNNSNLNLWASVQIMSSGFDTSLGCSTQFSITNRFMQQEMLLPGEMKSLIDYFEGEQYKTIPLQILQDYIDGVNDEASFYLKVWISTDSFDTDRMNQIGIPIEDQYIQESGIKRALDPYEPDWQTFTAEIKIVHKV